MGKVINLNLLVNMRILKSVIRLTNDLSRYAQMESSPVSLKRLYEFGKDADQVTLMGSGQFLHHELKVRIALRVRELENIGRLSEMPAIEKVREEYVGAFVLLQDTKKPCNPETLAEFTRILQVIKDNHVTVPNQISKGVHQLKETLVSEGT